MHASCDVVVTLGGAIGKLGSLITSIGGMQPRLCRDVAKAGDSLPVVSRACPG
jgi:hypothetical protein